MVDPRDEPTPGRKITKAIRFKPSGIDLRKEKAKKDRKSKGKPLDATDAVLAKEKSESAKGRKDTARKRRGGKRISKQRVRAANSRRALDVTNLFNEVGNLSSGEQILRNNIATKIKRGDSLNSQEIKALIAAREIVVLKRQNKIDVDRGVPP